MVTTISTSGSFKNTQAFLDRLKKLKIEDVLAQYGQRGVEALRSATPSDTGESASSWFYEIKRRTGGWDLIWRNNHMAGQTPVVILIQYGHGTGTGGYVQGYDFINPAIKPVFDDIINEVRKVVSKA